MPLSVLVGPAHAGKVARLLERYLDSLEREPFLIVPNRSDVERVERDLLRRRPALLGGSIGTFDDLFERIARDGGHRPLATEAQRVLILRRVIATQALDGLAASARFAGFADALGTAVAELQSALVEPQELDGGLRALYLAYREELDRLELWDRELERRTAAERVATELSAWDGRPVLAYGFEDLTGAQWTLLHALAGRSEVTVSLPYEPARPAFASLERTAADLTQLAGGSIEELPPRFADVARPGLAYLERSLFAERLPAKGLSEKTPAEAPEGLLGQAPNPPALTGELRFLEGSGTRGTLELVGDEILRLLRSGVPGEAIGVVCPSLERARAPLETAFVTLGVPFAVEDRGRLARTPYGHALLALLRFAWLGGLRRDLFTFLRSPYSGLARSHADYLEGRLRGRAISSPERVEQETLALRGGPIPFLEAVRSAPSPVAAVRSLAAGMIQVAYGLEAPPTGEAAELDLRAHETVAGLLEELQRWGELGGALEREDVVAALERATVRARPAGEPGRVAVLDLGRVRTRSFEALFVVGLEEGSLPRRGRASPFLDEEGRRELEQRSRRGRLALHDPIARERYLFYTACTRATRRLTLVREAATEDGSPREPSPFWDEVRSLFPAEEVERWTRRRPLSRLVWGLEDAPSERERLRALAALVPREGDEAAAIARANGWGRRLERARAAFDRPTRLAHPAILEDLRRQARFSVTELEAFADCSSIWLIDRVISPKTIDAEVDAKLRGSIAHSALFKFFSGLPRRLGRDRLEPAALDDALALLRESLEEALAGVRLELTELQRRELEQGLWRDLEQSIRLEATSELGLVPRRFEVGFGSDRSAPELQRGLELGTFAVSGKIDRIDVDPFSARGIVQDYKSGKTVHSAVAIDSELRLQIPLYILVLRDLIGIEPLGGVYRALGGERHARGLLRAEARDEGLPGFFERDYLEEDAFWAQIERAKEHASSFVERIRRGDVRHDPKNGPPCPSWCQLAPMCRVARQ